VWDTATEECLLVAEETGCSLSPDGALLAYGTGFPYSHCSPARSTPWYTMLNRVTPFAPVQK